MLRRTRRSRKDRTSPNRGQRARARAGTCAQGSPSIASRLLQGGGALRAYQAGVYEALAETGLDPDWVVGISIGAINAAIIAGNAPERRVDQITGTAISVDDGWTAQ